MVDSSKIVLADDLETKIEQMNNMIESLRNVDVSKVEGIVVGVLTRSNDETSKDDKEEGVPVDFTAFLMGVPEGIKFTFDKLLECTIRAIKDAQKAEKESPRSN